MRRIYTLLLFLAALYLGVHNGYVALWDTGSPQPVEVFPYRTILYPEFDRIALERQIPIEDQKDLSQLLEDYFS